MYSECSCKFLYRGCERARSMRQRLWPAELGGTWSASRSVLQLSKVRGQAVDIAGLASPIGAPEDRGKGGAHRGQAAGETGTVGHTHRETALDLPPERAGTGKA